MTSRSSIEYNATDMLLFGETEAQEKNAPDKYLIENSGLICSSDAWVLDECKRWFNLGAYIINPLPAVNILSFNNRINLPV